MILDRIKPTLLARSQSGYDVHLGFIGKRVVDFLLMLIELLSLGITAESLRAKRLSGE